MDDLISRQAAIDLFAKQLAERCGGNATWWKSVAEALVDSLPPAQPEIIRCMECKHWLDIDDGRQKHRMCADVYGDWFCADAEMRGAEKEWMI